MSWTIRRWLIVAASLGAAWAARATEYEYDTLDRLVRVVRSDGSEEAYTYDAAGNITSVTRKGRASTSILAKVGFRDAACEDGDVFLFEGRKGETVTVRVEAEPREAGLGKRLSVSLGEHGPRAESRRHDGPDLRRHDGSVLPNEIAAVLPADGWYTIVVARPDEGPHQARYAGAYRLTLEARPETCATLGPRGKHHP